MQKELQEIANRYGIALIYLFGSQAEEGKKYLEGKENIPVMHSDLDIAVVFKDTEGVNIKTYAFIFKEFSLIFDPFEIDLVFMHEQSPLFQYEVIKGIRIYSINEEYADNFEETIIKQAGDLSFKKKEFYQDIMEAIEDGYFEFKYSPYHRTR